MKRIERNLVFSLVVLFVIFNSFFVYSISLDDVNLVNDYTLNEGDSLEDIEDDEMDAIEEQQDFWDKNLGWAENQLKKINRQISIKETLSSDDVYESLQERVLELQNKERTIKKFDWLSDFIDSIVGDWIYYFLIGFISCVIFVFISLIAFLVEQNKVEELKFEWFFLTNKIKGKIKKGTNSFLYGVVSFKFLVFIVSSLFLFFISSFFNNSLWIFVFSELIFIALFFFLFNREVNPFKNSKINISYILVFILLLFFLIFLFDIFSFVDSVIFWFFLGSIIFVFFSFRFMKRNKILGLLFFLLLFSLFIGFVLALPIIGPVLRAVSLFWLFDEDFGGMILKAIGFSGVVLLIQLIYNFKRVNLFKKKVALVRKISSSGNNENFTNSEQVLFDIIGQDELRNIQKRIEDGELNDI